MEKDPSRWERIKSKRKSLAVVIAVSMVLAIVIPVIFFVDFKPRVEECSEDWRVSEYADFYRLEESFVEQLLCNLPVMPSDFDNVTRNIARGRITDLSVIGGNYYLQPEFYASSTRWVQRYFDKGLPEDSPMWTPLGWGFYPNFATWIVESHERSGIFRLTMFLRTAYGGAATDAWQGLYLVPEYPDEITFGGVQYMQDPAYAQSMFRVRSISTQDTFFEAHESQLVDNRRPGQFVLLKPTYCPVWYEDIDGRASSCPTIPGDWVRKVTVEVQVLGPQPGIYFLKIGAVNPDTVFHIREEPATEDFKTWMNFPSSDGPDGCKTCQGFGGWYRDAASQIGGYFKLAIVVR